MIPLFWPSKIDVNLLEREFFDEEYGTFRGRWWGQGPKVDLFEKKFGEKFGFKYPVMVNSGTAALHIAYILAGIKPGDEVIVPVLTCTATCHPIRYAVFVPDFIMGKGQGGYYGGGKIIFADIREDTLTLDPEDLERKITPKTKAVVPVHLGGLVTNRKEIKEIVSRKGRDTERPISIIEDACQALGAGTVGYGHFTCFSFQAIKALTTGDGGMLCCSKKMDYERALRLRWFDIDRKQKAAKGWQAWDRRGITFDQEEVGFKYQPTDIDASLGIVGLQGFDENQKHRHKLVKLYRENLANLGMVHLLETGDNSDWLFMVKVKDRNNFASFLLEQGIETNVAHIRNDLFKVFGGRRENLPGMKKIEEEYICLPLNCQVTEKDVLYICTVIRQWERG